MRFLRKAAVFLLVTIFCIGLTGVTETKADYFNPEDNFIEYHPYFTVDIIDGTRIKITIPAQPYYKIGENEVYYPEGYEITIVPDKKTSEKTTVSYCEGLYDLFTNLPKTGYGPYMQDDDDIKIGEPFICYEDGTEDRVFFCNNLPAGDYTVKVRGLLNLYWNTIESKISNRDITIKENESSKVKAGYKTKYDFSKVKTGDTIKFGAYEQDMNLKNGREPIEWIVLEKTDKQMLVISKYALDKLPYNNEYGDVTWATSTLRKWLNSSFYDYAFNKNEKKMIKTTTLKTKANPVSSVSGGKSTKDKVFLLSIQDVLNKKYGFSAKTSVHDKNRRTAYAWNQNAGGRWWLRTPAMSASNTLFVGSEGGLEYTRGVLATGGWSDSYIGLGVRPALYIKLG